MICTLNISSWQADIAKKEQIDAIEALENGAVVYLPTLHFEMQPEETELLSPTVLQGKSKNISFIPQKNKIKGSELRGHKMTKLMEFMTRFSQYSEHLIKNLLPHYKNTLMMGRTSYRPAEILGRKTSVRKDDTRLHVDAFPSAPNHGQRILRVFCNINPENKPRVWNLGEPFERVVRRFLHIFEPPLPGTRKMLQLAGVTKSYRSLYDHYMLQLHDNMKMNDLYQSNLAKQEFQFPSGTTWIVMTDSVSHAALAGQHLLEQTFYLPPEAMKNPENSPLRILERYLDTKLIDLH